MPILPELFQWNDRIACNLLVDFLCVGDKARRQYQGRRAIHDGVCEPQRKKTPPNQRVGIHRQDRISLFGPCPLAKDGRRRGLGRMSGRWSRVMALLTSRYRNHIHWLRTLMTVWDEMVIFEHSVKLEQGHH